MGDSSEENANAVGGNDDNDMDDDEDDTFCESVIGWE